jgi:uncharacterized protein YegL
MATDEKKQQVLPVYLVIDVSYSMAGDAIKSAQQAVDDILFEIKTIPTLAESAFIAVITFCERADRIMPMSNLSYVDASPVLELGASTSYVAAIDAVLADLRDDVAEMKANGKAVFRPCVFFLTDGEPTDLDADLDAALQRLHASQPLPNVIPIGVGQAPEDRLKQLATNGFPAWKANGELGPAMAEVAKALVRSVVSSVKNSQQDQGDGGGAVFDMTPMQNSPNITPVMDLV